MAFAKTWEEFMDSAFIEEFGEVARKSIQERNELRRKQEKVRHYASFREFDDAILAEEFPRYRRA